MNQQDKAFMTAFSVVLGALVVIAIICFIIASAVASSGLVKDEAGVKMIMEKRIAPVGRVVMAGSAEAKADAEDAQKAIEVASAAAAASSGDMTGDAVYAAACTACHSTNFPNAPQLGNKEQWQPRFDKGLDMLVSNAINGINTMPAKGGNAALSDQNIKDAVVYMLNESGFEVAGDSAAAADSGEEKSAEQDASAAAATTEEKQPAQTETTAAATTEEKQESQAEQAPADSGAAAPAFDLAQGETVYKKACGLCHDTGAANAPKYADKAAWTARLEQGFDTLAGHAINGFKTMPAKGGNVNLTDDEVKAAVAYMLESVK